MSENSLAVSHCVCLAILLFARLFHCHPALHLDVLPAPSCGEQVRVHNVSCTLDVTLTSMNKVFSLTVFASRLSGNAGKFNPLVTVDLWKQRPHVLSGMITPDVNVTGRIGTEGDTISQLAFSWKPPQNCEIGEYKCVAIGLDSQERGVSISKNSAAVPGNESRSNRSRTLSLLEGVANDTAEIRDKIRDLDVLQQQVQNLQEMVTAQSNAIATLSRSIYGIGKFDSSSIFRGKRYHVSKVVSAFDINVANDECKAIGGNLVEIGDRDEYDFVLRFVRRVGGTVHFYTGAYDIDREGEWKFLDSQKRVSYFNWASGQPDNARNVEDCMEISLTRNFFNDIICNHRGKFICETQN